MGNNKYLIKSIDWPLNEDQPYPVVECPRCGKKIVDGEDGAVSNPCEHVAFVEVEDAGIVYQNPALFWSNDEAEHADLVCDEWPEWATAKFGRNGFGIIKICIGTFPGFHTMMVGFAPD